MSRTPDRELRESHDSSVEERIRASFARQQMMRTLGAELVAVCRGEVAIALPFRDDLTQQHGFLHAAATTAIVDSACGCAALTLMAPEAEVLSVEFKVNLLAPAAGERLPWGVWSDQGAPSPCAPGRCTPSRACPGS